MGMELTHPEIDEYSCGVGVRVGLRRIELGLGPINGERDGETRYWRFGVMEAIVEVKVMGVVCGDGLDLHGFGN